MKGMGCDLGFGQQKLDVEETSLDQGLFPDQSRVEIVVVFRRVDD